MLSGRFIANGVAPLILWSWDGDTVGGRFGFSVSGAGDANGDGFDDVIVGEPWAGVGTIQGRIKVFSGRHGGVMHSFDGDFNGSKFGRSVSGAGDINLDGLDDFVVGAWADPTNGDRAGMFRVYNGRSGAPLITVYGSAAFERVGHSVSDAGDVNGDGWPDLVMGAYEGGFVRVYSGRNIDTGNGPLVLHDWPTPLSGALFGWSVSGAGDVDGDGNDDLIVGGYLHSTDGHIQNGSAHIYSGTSGNLLFRLEGDDSHDHLGTSVHGAGDVNGDGRSDVIVGVPDDDSNGSNSGMVRVVKFAGCPASWSNYGTGVPGFVGIPTLELDGNPVIGTTVNLEAQNSVGFTTTTAVVFAGLSPANIPTSWGGDLLVTPLFVIPLVMPLSGLSLPMAIPADDTLCGVHFYFQVLQLEPIGAQNTSFTRGLEASFGY